MAKHRHRQSKKRYNSVKCDVLVDMYVGTLRCIDNPRLAKLDISL